jgi:hypothetical protein
MVVALYTLMSREPLGELPWSALHLPIPAAAKISLQGLGKCNT